MSHNKKTFTSEFFADDVAGIKKKIKELKKKGIKPQIKRGGSPGDQGANIIVQIRWQE